MICFESCQAAAAYKNTIRGAKPVLDTNITEQMLEDYPQIVPKFPIFGIGDRFGDTFDNISGFMYIQMRI